MAPLCKRMCERRSNVVTADSPWCGSPSSVNSDLPYLPDGTGIRPVRVGSKVGGA
jgi:hypothetical protein